MPKVLRVTVLLCAAGLAAPMAAAAAPTAATRLSASPVPASDAWKRLVVDPGAVVLPKDVRVIGDATAVTDPDGLRAAGGAATTIRATGAGTPRLVLDLGANTGGRVEVGITRTDGSKVRLGYAELRGFLTPLGDTCLCGSIPLSVSPDDDPEARTDVIATGTPGAWRSPGVRGAQRYVALQLEGPGTVSIDYVRVRVTHLRAPVSAYAGHFDSSDPVLDRAWYASVHTFAMDAIKGTSGRTVVTDGAKRDRLIWAGDLAIENLLGTYSLRSAPRIIRSSLQAFSCRQLADGELPPLLFVTSTCPETPAQPPGTGVSAFPEYTAWWVVALRDYVLATGDRAFARRVMPVARRALAHFTDRLRGGVYVTPATGQNWHPSDEAAGEDAHTNATLYRALRAGADLERWAGTGARAAARYAAQAAVLRRAMVTRLWDEEAGAFLGNRSNPRRNHTQDAQVEAVYAGVTDATQARRALRFLTTRLLGRLGTATGESGDDPYMSRYVSPFISSSELLARLGHRDTAGALTLIRRTWGHMQDMGPGTLWEKIGLDGLPANYMPLQAPADPFAAGNLGAGWTSLAHGWGGGPVPALSGYVLGLRPVTPGFRTWVVAPQPGDLRFARGQAPTPHGALAARWIRTTAGGGSFRLTISAPAGTRGAVDVPTLGRRRVIAMDGRVVWDGSRARGGVRAVRTDGAVRFSGLSGRHTLAWTGAVR